MHFEQWVAENPDLDIPQWIRDFCASNDKEERAMILAHKPVHESLLLSKLWSMYLKETRPEYGIMHWPEDVLQYYERGT